MPELSHKQQSRHRTTERYYCPPFFQAYISVGEEEEKRGTIVDLGLCGMKVKTTQEFERGRSIKVKLVSKYAAPVRIRGRVRWARASDGEDSSYLIGLSITRIRIPDWFRFIRIVSQVRKEVW
jgi:hypothetical protein